MASGNAIRGTRVGSSPVRWVDASADRIEAVGRGEHYPVASNNTAAGRQQNRRVEIVFSDEKGQFNPSAERAARSG